MYMLPINPLQAKYRTCSAVKSELGILGKNSMFSETIFNYNESFVHIKSLEYF